LHRRTNNYFDLLPLSPDREQTLKARMDEQHRTIVEAIRSGELSLSLPAEEAAPAPSAVPHAASLKLELMNPRTWLTGKRASLQVAVRDHAGNAVKGAIVTTKVDGAAEPTESSTVTGASGEAQFEFEMPRLTSAESALVIEAMRGNVKGQLRFQLRSKPRVPSAG